VMSEMGKAMMGTGEADGDNRALEAAEAAISNPLLDEVSMKGAQGVLINITGGMDLTLFEVDEAANRIRSEVDPEANILVGSALDSSLDGKMRVSVVATGIEASSMAKDDIPQKQYSTPKEEAPKIEERAEVNEEPVAEIAEEPLELVDEVVDDVEDQFMEDDITENRDAPFIAPEPEMPEETIEVTMAAQEEVADPYAEAALANIEPREKPRQKLGLFQNLLGTKKEPTLQREPVLRQGDMLSEPKEELELETPEPVVEEKIVAEPEAIITEEPIVKKEQDDDHLEIPAFLRRQAN